MTESVECVVVGAGVVGLAIARCLAEAGVETFVLEKERQIGSGTSSRNSEVIHAGIYYPPGSLKSRLCVAGKHMLYGYCRDRDIDHKRCGKLIVATEEQQLGKLRQIVSNARAAGVDDLRILERGEALQFERELNCVGAVHSPSTGIVDSHALMTALHGDLENAGATVVFGSPVQSGRCTSGGIVLNVGGDSEMEIHSRIVVNSAGLHAQRVAAALDGLAPEFVPQGFLAKGNYYGLDRRSPFTHLVYPVPADGGLGVHLTLDLGGRARFGPDVEWIDEIDYDVDPGRSQRFYAEIRRYWPGLPDGALSPGYAGVRPKLHGPGTPAADFRIDGPAKHGIPGLVNLFGIESPGLTAALAIAQYVRSLLSVSERAG